MQNSGTIYVEPNELSSKIAELKSERESMQQIFESIENDGNNMINYWSGTVGDKTYEKMDIYTQNFPSIIAQIDSYISFLESVISSYKVMDSTIESKMEENASVSAI